jgi:hypothetical protein
VQSGLAHVSRTAAAASQSEKTYSRCISQLIRDIPEFSNFFNIGSRFSYDVYIEINEEMQALCGGASLKHAGERMRWITPPDK